MSAKPFADYLKNSRISEDRLRWLSCGNVPVVPLVTSDVN